jgi:molecular chaperone GrpE
MAGHGVDGRKTGRPPDPEDRAAEAFSEETAASPDVPEEESVDGSVLDPQRPADTEQVTDTEAELATTDDVVESADVLEPDADDRDETTPEGLRVLAEERLNDLQRLQAEYVNYRRRVERDRDVARETAVATVLEALLPVLDDVHLARQHGDLDDGPFAAIAEKLESTLSRFGLSRYGEPGEAFDPTVHEALMRTEADLNESATEPTVAMIMQPGYRAGERVLRPARVAVTDPG